MYVFCYLQYDLPPDNPLGSVGPPCSKHLKIRNRDFALAESPPPPQYPDLDDAGVLMDTGYSSMHSNGCKFV